MERTAAVKAGVEMAAGPLLRPTQRAFLVQRMQVSGNKARIHTKVQAISFQHPPRRTAAALPMNSACSCAFQLPYARNSTFEPLTQIEYVES